MKHVLAILALIVAGLLIAAERPVAWAVPMERAGLPNLHRVDAKLYRSAQPTAEGMTNLVALHPQDGQRAQVSQKANYNGRKTSLVYLERDGKYLILHRTKKEHDENGDKWIGVGGKFEPGETIASSPLTARSVVSAAVGRLKHSPANTRF